MGFPARCPAVPACCPAVQLLSMHLRNNVTPLLLEHVLFAVGHLHPGASGTNRTCVLAAAALAADINFLQRDHVRFAGP